MQLTAIRILVAIIIVVAAVSMGVWNRHRQLNAPWTIGTIAGLILLGLGISSASSDANALRLKDLTISQAAIDLGNKQRDYELCLARVDSRTQYRIEKQDDFDSEEFLFNAIDAAVGSDHFTALPLIPGQPSLRQNLMQRRVDLDRRSPQLSDDSCQKPGGTP